ncbi:hypothetical protein TNCV_3357151 [Trichonephila clavipes]|nr:hypothetical protein TNCV_3357151 [Trichonephila clavipes]
MLGYRLDPSLQHFHLPEAVAIYRALHHQDSTLRPGRLYSTRVSISCFAGHHQSRRNHRQRASGQRGSRRRRISAAGAVPLSDMKRVIMHHILTSGGNHGVSSWTTNCTL